MHLRQRGFVYSACVLHVVLADNLQKTKTKYEHLKKHEIHDIFIKTN